VDGHQMYSGGSMVYVKPQSFINWSGDVAYPFRNFYRGSESAKFGVVFNITQL